jgi:hypothetical protein
LAFAELAQTDIEYQQESWPLAFVAGYFSHLALDRVLNALIQRLVREHLGDNQDHMELQYNCEHFQSLFFHREFFGEDILGTAKGYELCNILSQKGKRFEESLILFCIKGCLKAFGKAPSRRELKRWRGGFCRFSALRNKSFKIDKRIISGKTGQKIAHTFYRNDFFDFVDYYSRALELSVEYINNIFDYMRGGNYSSAAREEFTEMVPEMDIYNPPEEEQNYPLMLPEEAARFFNESVPKLDFIQEVKKEGRKILPFINPRKPAPKGPRL